MQTLKSGGKQSASQRANKLAKRIKATVEQFQIVLKCSMLSLWQPNNHPPLLHSFCHKIIVRTDSEGIWQREQGKNERRGGQGRRESVLPNKKSSMQFNIYSNKTIITFKILAYRNSTNMLKHCSHKDMNERQSRYNTKSHLSWRPEDLPPE